MILPDINVLVYPFREGEPQSTNDQDWLTDLTGTFHVRPLRSGRLPGGERDRARGCVGHRRPLLRPFPWAALVRPRLLASGLRMWSRRFSLGREPFDRRAHQK